MLNNESSLQKGRRRVRVPAARCFCLCTQPCVETRECRACLVVKHRFLCQMKLCGCRNSVRVCFPEGKYTHWIPAGRPRSATNASGTSPALPAAMGRERAGPQASRPISGLNQTDLGLKSKGCWGSVQVHPWTWSAMYLDCKLFRTKIGFAFCLCLCRCLVQLHD